MTRLSTALTLDGWLKLTVPPCPIENVFHWISDRLRLVVTSIVLPLVITLVIPATGFAPVGSTTCCPYALPAAKQDATAMEISFGLNLRALLLDMFTPDYDL